jgi:phosphoenolpyruvate-protein kinase (PTS system EI component)
MIRNNVNIIGMPYFPGMAVGELLRGTHGDIAQRIVLVTQDEIAELETAPAGVIVVDAAPFSHNLITLLGLGVPTVLISRQQANRLQDATTLYIDGISGQITDDLSEAKRISTTAIELTSHLTRQAVLMADGEALALNASVRQPALAKQAAQRGAQAIGLVRTEFLIPTDGSLPVRWMRHLFPI